MRFRLVRRLETWPYVLVALLATCVPMWILPNGRFYPLLDRYGWNLAALQHLRFHLLWIDLFMVPDKVLPPLIITFSVACYAVAERRVGSIAAFTAFMAWGPLSSVFATLAAWALYLAGVTWVAPQLFPPDVGASAAGYACWGLFVAALAPRWRDRVLGLTSPFLLGPFLIPGTRYGIGHLVAFGLGFGHGLLLVWRQARPRPFPGNLPLTGLRRRWPVWSVALLAALTGVAQLLRALLARVGDEPRAYESIIDSVPLLNRSLSLVFGSLLLYLSFNLRRRKRMAWRVALLFALLVLVSYIPMSHVRPGAILALATVAVLLAYRDRFTVRSEVRGVPQALGIAALALSVALAYGVFGFYLMDRRDFNHDFQLGESLEDAIREYLLLGNSDLSPNSRHAQWFLDSLQIFGAVTVAYVAVSLFRPLRYRFSTLPLEIDDARRVLERHGNSDVDYFKLMSPKSYYFSPTRDAFLAYRVRRGVAVALGEPSGPSSEQADLLQAWIRFCNEQGWMCALLHVPDPAGASLDAARLRLVKIGEVARVRLDAFADTTSRNPHFGRIERKFERMGAEAQRSAAPHDPRLLAEMEHVSDEWLSLPGRREHGFAMGWFDRAYLDRTPVFTLRDGDGRLLAFANEPPTYVPHEATIDLMRHRADIPNGAMDYLLRELLLDSHARGFATFDLGLAPLARVRDWPGAGYEERALDLLQQRVQGVFSFRGLMAYKQKFEPRWDPSYLAYQGGPGALLRTAVALTRVLEP